MHLASNQYSALVLRKKDRLATFDSAQCDLRQKTAERVIVETVQKSDFAQSGHDLLYLGELPALVDVIVSKQVYLLVVSFRES